LDTMKTVCVLLGVLVCLQAGAVVGRLAPPQLGGEEVPEAGVIARDVSKAEALELSSKQAEKTNVLLEDIPMADKIPPPPSSQEEAGDIAQAKTEADLGMMMQMTFFASNKFLLWFKSFNVSSAGELTAACLGCVVMAMLYEGLKVARILITTRFTSSRYSSPGHWIQSFLHATQVTFSYFLMLAVMTYSTWIMISVCVGAWLGYFVFARFVPVMSLLGQTSEHCH